MSINSVQSLPPGMARQFADRARRMDGCVTVSEDRSIYEWAQGNNVVCLIMLDPPMGHVKKDAHRAEQIRKELAKATGAASPYARAEQP